MYMAVFACRYLLPVHLRPVPLFALYCTLDRPPAQASRAAPSPSRSCGQPATTIPTPLPEIFFLPQVDSWLTLQTLTMTCVQASHLQGLRTHGAQVRGPGCLIIVDKTTGVVSTRLGGKGEEARWCLGREIACGQRGPAGNRETPPKRGW